MCLGSQDRTFSCQTMKKVYKTVFLLFFTNLLHISLSLSRDTIIPTQPLIHPQTLVSSGGGVFELGFFAPNKGFPDQLYLGIWYKNLNPQTVVWVANRRTPVPPSAGSLNLSRDGNLAVGRVWSINISGRGAEPVVELLHTGNLVLTDGGYDGSDSPVWQSFDYPSDSMLPGMKLGWDLRINLDRRFTSWRSESDPAPGDYSAAMDLKGQIFVSNGSRAEYRTRPWDGMSRSDTSSLNSTYPINPKFVSTTDEIYYTYEMVDPSIISFSRIDHLGSVVRLVWTTNVWKSKWTFPADTCDYYGRCGAYGVCNNSTSPIICNCLEGFEPNSMKGWNRGDGGGGCKRKAAINCSTGDQFQKVSQLKLPDMSNATIVKYVTSDDCRDRCLKNCSCMAYAFLNEGTGCITWVGDLVDLRLWPSGAGEDLYVRLARGGSQRRAPMIAAVSSTIGLLILVTLICFVWTRRQKCRGIVEVIPEESPFALEIDVAKNLAETKSGDSEFSIFQFPSMAFATENFSNFRKLGEGGFGSVYKGRLPSGQEIAVKRLATHSGQGLVEFKNEIALIAKLQHRNLVRLLGCCIQGEEKLLVYEYMPNKSLDFILFDPASGEQLDWISRSHIVEGIAQGLLYLHKHSRLRIVHRDLKPSNILLDADMNPKISDFGMARIFSSNEVQANTVRVVGTFGYMSPEYAAEGLFSIKSDVFSFGVVLLEIISGKRNVGFQHENFLNLLGYSWVLWKEGKWMELVDPKTKHAVCHVGEIQRCIHLALLCIQEFPADRPTMSIVVTMLSSESVVLPDPKKPAFFNVNWGAAEFESSNSGPCSQNETTSTVIDVL